jgi:hypothetical protein
MLLQPETKTVFLRRETVIEDGGDIFRRNANAIVRNLDFIASLAVEHAQGQRLIRPIRAGRLTRISKDAVFIRSVSSIRSAIDLREIHPSRDLPLHRN